MKTKLRLTAILITLHLSVIPFSWAVWGEYGAIESVEKAYAWIGTGIIEGDVTYRIGGHVTDPSGEYVVSFPISELKWQLSSVNIVTAGAGVFLFEKLELAARFSQAGQTKTGVMKDSDWTIPGIPKQYLADYKTIYSESDSTVKFYENDLTACYWFGESYSAFEIPHRLGFVLGYLYQSFDWDASNVDQWYPLFPSMPHDTAEGLAGTYSAKLKVPYAAFAGKAETDKYAIECILGYSPLAVAEDEDYHLLRSIVARSKGEGSAFKGRLSGRYDLLKNLFLTLRGEFLILAAEGRADTLAYDGANKGDTWTIDHKVNSTNYTMSLNLGLRF